MGIKIITPPDLTALVADVDLRKHLKLATDGTEDELMRPYFSAAHAAAEHYTGRPIGEQTRELALDEFPEDAFVLGPAVASITSVKYLDTSGVEQTLAPSAYALDHYNLECSLVPAVDTTWPDTLDAANAVKVRFVAGDLPDAVRAAMLLMTGFLFQNRGDDARVSDDLQPPAAKALLNTVKIWGF